MSSNIVSQSQVVLDDAFREKCSRVVRLGVAIGDTRADLQAPTDQWVRLVPALLGRVIYFRVRVQRTDRVAQW